MTRGSYVAMAMALLAGCHLAAPHRAGPAGEDARGDLAPADAPSSDRSTDGPRDAGWESSVDSIEVDAPATDAPDTDALGSLVVRTVAGAGVEGYKDGPALTALFEKPYGLAAYDGKIYVADRNNSCVRFIDRAMGKVGTFAGVCQMGGYQDGPVTIAQFATPRGIASDGTGAFFVGDVGNHRVRKIAGNMVSTIAGDCSPGFADGADGQARFNKPYGVAVDAMGRVYVADTNNYRIRVIDQGQVSTFAGSGIQGLADGPALQAQIHSPFGIAVDDQGRVYFAEKDGHVVRVIEAQ